jgi:hypothetical protein
MDHGKTSHHCTCKRCGDSFTIVTESGPSDICGSCARRIWLVFTGESHEDIDQIGRS